MRLFFALAVVSFLLFPVTVQAAVTAAINGPAVLTKDMSGDYTIMVDGAVGGLKTVHDAKMHLLVIDESMTDYQHIHPAETANGFTFSFTPKTAHNYTAWVDITEAGGRQHYLPLALTGTAACAAPCVDKTVAETGTDGVVTGKLAFDRALAPRNMAMAVLMVEKNDGTQLGDLEPVMGAFAHVVGFYAERPEVVHLHPVKKTAAGKGYELLLHLDTGAAGTIKLFAQVKVDGQEHVIPFTLTVK